MIFVFLNRIRKEIQGKVIAIFYPNGRENEITSGNATKH
jgi:hypothetical protein